MARNTLQRCLYPPYQRLICGIAVVMGLLPWLPADAQEPIDPADRLPPELREKLLPQAMPLEHEGLVVRSSLINALPGTLGIKARLVRVWEDGGGVVLEGDRPGLKLHYYAEGIEAMTLADKLWEGLPKRADSMQALIDEVIGKSRSTGRPISHLIVTGHAGLPGCSAFGGTMDDCTFRGVLSAYQRDQLARLRPYLAVGAEIELRQCGTASGEEGKRLLTAVYEITGATTSSYLADFHFGDSAAHPRIRVGVNGYEVVPGE